MHHLIIQGPDIATGALKALAQRVRADGIERITDNAFRLCNALQSDAAQATAIAQLCAEQQLDYGFIPATRQLKDFGLLVTDMDSTLISIECIDEIADMIGLKDEVARITEASMRGEVDFSQSLIQRTALLAGLDATALQRVYDERLQLNAGAENMLRKLRSAGIKTVLVSGGFSFFTSRLQERLQLDGILANELEIANGKLTGRIVGDIVDAQAKRAALIQWQTQLGLHSTQTIALGDGANDLAMFDAAGIAIAYRAKPKVQAAATYCLNHADLEGVIPLLGTNLRN